MQATTRSKQFVVDHRTIALTVAIAALIAVAGGASLLTTMRMTDDSGIQTGVAKADSSAQQAHRPTDRPASMTGSARLDTESESGLDRAGHWAAFPGHAGFTNESTSRLDRIEQMAQFFDAKMARLEAAELRASVRAAQADAARRQLEMDRKDYIDSMRRH